jgi:ElaB/YqjD/DUF883 family membrane-anchored ribosome-binding protein
MASQTFPLDEAVRNQGNDTQDAGHAHNAEEAKRPTSAVGEQARDAIGGQARAIGEQARNVRDTVSSAADQAWQTTSAAMDRAGDRLGSYAENYRPYVRQVRRQGERGVGALEDAISEHPLVSIGIAIGVGFLIGRYLAD